MRVLWSRALSNRAVRGVTGGKKKRPETNRVGMVRGWENITERAFLVGCVVPPRPTCMHTNTPTTHSYSHGAEGKNAFILIFKQKYIAWTCGSWWAGQLYRKKCDPCQLGKERREHCSETMAETGKINSYILPSEWKKYNIWSSLHYSPHTIFVYT